MSSVQEKEDSNNACQLYREKKTAIMCVKCTGKRRQQKCVSTEQGKEDSNNVCQREWSLKGGEGKGGLAPVNAQCLPFLVRVLIFSLKFLQTPFSLLLRACSSSTSTYHC